MLLMKVELDPIRMKYGKGTRLAALNHVLTMNHWNRKRLHDDFLESYKRVISASYKKYPWGHSKETTYSVSLGYMKGSNEGGRKTGRVDTDGFSYLLKVGIDALVQSTCIPDDSCDIITETRIKYLGQSEDGHEHLYLQLTSDSAFFHSNGTQNQLSMPTPTQSTPKPKDGSEVPPKAKMEEIYRDSYLCT